MSGDIQNVAAPWKGRKILFESEMIADLFPFMEEIYLNSLMINFQNNFRLFILDCSAITT